MGITSSFYMTDSIIRVMRLDWQFPHSWTVLLKAGIHSSSLPHPQDHALCWQIGNSTSIWKTKWKQAQTPRRAYGCKFSSRQLTFPFHEVSSLAVFSSKWIISVNVTHSSAEEFYLLSKSCEESLMYILHIAWMVFYFKNVISPRFGKHRRKTSWGGNTWLFPLW